MQIILRFVDSVSLVLKPKTEKGWFSFSNTNVETVKGQF